MASDRKARAERAELLRKEREKAGRRQRNLITVGIAVAVVALIALGAWAVSSGKSDDDRPIVAPAHTNAAYGFDYSAADAGGIAGADPVTVVLYEDFQCPICQGFETEYGPTLDGMVAKGEITIEYRPFAFLDRYSSTDYSTRAANAAMAVLDKGGVTAYKKFHGLLFANQPPEGGAGLDDATLIDYAKQAGVTGIDAAVEGGRFEPWVKAAVKAGNSDGVDGTPTVRIDDKIVNGPEQNGQPTVPSLAAIQQAIAAAAKP